jgi:hypothetical protein
MPFFQKFSKITNEYSLEALGAGGAVWAAFFAIPNFFIQKVCGKDSCDHYNETAHGIIIASLAVAITINAL